MFLALGSMDGARWDPSLSVAPLGVFFIAIYPASSAKDSRKSGPLRWLELAIHWPDRSEEWMASLL